MINCNTVDIMTPGKGNAGFSLLIFHDVTCCCNSELCLWFRAGRGLLSLCLQLSPESIMSPSQTNAAFRWHACQGLLLSPCYSCTAFQGATLMSDSHGMRPQAWGKLVRCTKKLFGDLWQFKEQGWAFHSSCSLKYDNAAKSSVWFIPGSTSLTRIEA